MKAAKTRAVAPFFAASFFFSKSFLEWKTVLLCVYAKSVRVWDRKGKPLQSLDLQG